MSYDSIQFSADNGVARIELHRPERLNALRFDMIAEIKSAIDRSRGMQDVRCLVISGAGRAFCAGDNIKEMGEAPHGNDPLLRMRESGYISIVRALRSLDKPVVACAHGHTLGAGLEVFMGADIRIATHDASLGVPFIKLGLAGGAYQLPRFVGVTRAAAMLFSGEPVSGREAYEMGLVTEVADDTDGMHAACHRWTELLKQRSTSSIGLIKRALYRCYETSYDTAIELAALNFVTATLSGERQKGVDAWLQSRAEQTDRLTPPKAE